MFEDEMLTIEDLADYLKLKPQTIYKWAQTGKIPGAKFGKEWRFRRSTIEQWIDDNFPPRSKAPPKTEGEANPVGRMIPTGDAASKDASTRVSGSSVSEASEPAVSRSSVSRSSGIEQEMTGERDGSLGREDRGNGDTAGVRTQARKKGAKPSSRKKAHGPSAN